MLPSGRQRGTTLIEVLISILLLSLGLLSLVGLHARTLQTTVDAENRGNAALLANEMVSAMWDAHSVANSTAVQAVFTNWNSVASRALPGASPYPSYTIGAPDANGAVALTISWVAPGQQSASQTLISHYVTTVAIP